MPTHQTLERVHTIIWVLIYGGLLAFVLGIALHRYGEGLWGTVLMVVGAFDAAAGVLLLVWRSRQQVSDGPKA